MLEPCALPWFGSVEGFALVPPEGALLANEDPAAVVVLTKGGQLMVHDLKTSIPVPLNLPFQVCCTSLAVSTAAQWPCICG